MTLASGISVPVERIAEICRQYQVRELSLFGSAVRGGMGPDSDIDVLVEFDADARIGILRFTALSDDLEAVFGRKVDLVTKLGLKPWVRSHVLSEAKVLYAA
jgi:hypothetical protein